MSDSCQTHSAADVFDWLTRQLSQHIHTISSLQELQHDWLDGRHTQPVSVIICLNDSESSTTATPLFLAVLSVILDSQVRFAQVAQSIAVQALRLPQPQQQMSVVVHTAQLTYVYGGGDADCMTLAAVRLMLLTLAPSAADLLDVAVTLSLLLLCLEPCLVCSGLKSRLLSFMSFSIQLCFVFLVYCFFVSYVIPEYELHLLFDDLMPVWQYVMLTSFGDLVRSDWLRYTSLNFNSFLVTYFMYLLLVAWFYHRLCRQKRTSLTTFWNSVIDEEEDKEYINWYTWQYFGVPDFWLQSLAPRTETSRASSVQSGNTSTLNSCAQCEQPLSYGCKVCRLACQHVFHRSCLSDLVCSHECFCPTCDCPIYANTALDEFSVQQMQ